FQSHGDGQRVCNGEASGFYVGATNREGRCESERKPVMDRRNNRTTAEIERKPVTFSRDELWLLHDFVRHELPESRQWRYPPASEELNEEIVVALDACETHELPEYTLLLSKGDMLVIDFFIRRDHRTPEGASGKNLLLKIFRARSELSSGLVEHEGNDFAYREVRKDAAADYDSGTNAGCDTNRRTKSDAPAR